MVRALVGRGRLMAADVRIGETARFAGPHAVALEQRLVDESTLRRRALDEGWVPFVAGMMPWSVIINPVTFDEEALGHPVRRPEAVHRFTWFLEACRKTLERPVEGFVACEVGPNGHLEHGHGLMALGAGLRKGDITALSRLWRSRPGHGLIFLEVPRSVVDVTAYATKHTVKDLGDIVWSLGCGRHWYEGWG